VVAAPAHTWGVAELPEPLLGPEVISIYCIKQLQLRGTGFIIRLLFTNHSQLTSGVFGVWGFGVMG
jgi:hypothetical protein